jgi:hypothetical protein
MIKQKNEIMELTLENLILFLEKEYPYDNGFKPQTRFRDNGRECTIDGDDALDLLLSLKKEFDVTFENFNFQKYFLEESELNTLNLKSLLFRKKKREIIEELTVRKLFDYMIANVKTD